MFALVGRTLRRPLVRDRLEDDSETGDGAVNNIDEHTAKHLHRGNGRYLLHVRLSDELALEDTSENDELVDELLAELVHQARRRRGVALTAVRDRDLAFHRQVVVLVAKFVERAADERLFRDEVRDAFGA